MGWKQEEKRRLLILYNVRSVFTLENYFEIEWASLLNLEFADNDIYYLLLSIITSLLCNECLVVTSTGIDMI